MLVVAILGTIGAVVWTVLAIQAKALSKAPSLGFEGGGLVAIMWLIVAALWAVWWFA
jgi:hypothetical protein